MTTSIVRDLFLYWRFGRCYCAFEANVRQDIVLFPGVTFCPLLGYLGSRVVRGTVLP